MNKSIQISSILPNIEKILQETLVPEYVELIQKASELSLGEKIERGDLIEKIKDPLVSIFLNTKKNQIYYYPVKPLSLDRSVLFPKLKLAIIGLSENYNNLWNNFKEEFEKVDKKDFITIYHLLQKYTTFIPFSNKHKDISLFDYEKTTCAIADCLHKNNGKVEFLLVGGDLSGIKKFIYTVSSKSTVKSLRGRSFYLQLLSETLAKYIIKKLDLTIANILFCEGGHFYILVPSSAEEELKNARAYIEKVLLDAHKGELYLVLDWIKLTEKDFKGKEFSERLWNLNNILNKKKKQKFAETLTKNPKELFDTIETGGLKEVCDICRNEEKEYYYRDENGKWKSYQTGMKVNKLCQLCKSFEDLAKNLSKANYIIESTGYKEEIYLEGWEKIIAKFHKEYSLLKEFKEEYINYLKEEDNVEEIVVYTLNDTDFLDLKNLKEKPTKNSKISFGFKFLANKTPRYLKDFEDFAREGTGIKKWAILRLDVDDLGIIFREGLKKEGTAGMPISRLSALSSKLSLFFNGWIHRTLEKYDNIYLIYSGGDDLFIVGSWHLMPEIAKEIYDDFREFTCNNITLSCGIEIAPNIKYPLSALLSYEEKSVKDKDAMFFLQPLKWKDFKKVFNLKDALMDLRDSELLQKLYVIYNEYEIGVKKKGKIFAKYDDRYGRWRWLLIYTIARMKEKYKNKEEKLENLQMLIRDNIEYLPIAIRWVELYIRY
ncbi:MAG: type III-A CRISPR-associated protein Cas10/Csm1 [Methanosarcinales archaeon]